MGIKEDIERLKIIEDQSYSKRGYYIQALPTPEIIPTIGDSTNITELRPAEGTPNRKILFTPTSKDYQFTVNVHTSPAKKGRERVYGYEIIACRILDYNIIETIRTNIVWSGIPSIIE